MQGFDDVKIGWKGVEYTIPANRVLTVVASIEEAIRGNSEKQAVQILTQPGGPTYSRLAMGYGAALRGAGASVSDDEVYLTIQEGFANGEADAATMVQRSVLGLFAIISPPVNRALNGVSEDDAEKKSNAAG